MTPQRSLTIALCAVALAVLLPTTASAQQSAEHPDARNTNLEVNSFHLNPSGYGIFATQSGELLTHLEFRGEVAAQYIDRPLVVDPSDGSSRALVDWRQQLDVTAAIGLFNWVELGIIAPVAVTQDAELPGFGLGPVADGGLGNLEAYVMARILSQRRGAPLSLSVGSPVSIPTHTSNGYLGTNTVSASPKVRLSRDFGPVRTALNVGTTFQEPTSLNNVVEEDRLSVRVGAMYTPDPRWGVGVEYLGSTQLTDPLGDADATRGEIIGGARFRPVRWLDLRIAGGASIDRGLGAPAFRAVLGAAVHLGRPPAPGDEPEPDPCETGQAPASECPDADYDGDGIPNMRDECPNEAEDKDGDLDGDGCPEGPKEDGDGDGVRDLKDDCPAAAEDVDGWADQDGCPDLDNDGDGLGDEDDECPDKPEDFDGYEDSDGCPDTDNDDDGVPDIKDNCPFGPGPAEQQGCPDDKRPEAKLTSERIELSEKIYFVTNQAIIKDRSLDALQKVAEVLKANPDIRKVEVRGYADQRGESRYNYHLSLERAKVIRLYLTRKAGIDPDRVEAAGYGEAGGEDDPDYAEARRVEFKILERGADDE